MSLDNWRKRAQERLEADLRHLGEVDREIEKQRRLRERIAGKIDARRRDLEDFDAALSAEPEPASSPTRQALKHPALHELAGAEGGMTEADLCERLRANPKSLHTCLWRLERETPPLIVRVGGVISLTEAGYQAANTAPA